MKIGWMIRVGGIFGSVREAIETGNALMRLGHDFTMYTDEARDLGWLPNTLNWKHTKDAATDDLDFLFWSDSPDDPYYGVFNASKAKVKSFCVMGFSPDQCGDIFLTDRHQAIIDSGAWITCDGPWQLEYIKRYTDNYGPAIGAVNVEMFSPKYVPNINTLIWSGDPRPRKGGDLVKSAIYNFNSDFYSKKRIAQKDMADFICKALIFVDGHNRGGWCNPVMEAMACARAVVCTDTYCNSDFAVHEFNCLKANTPLEMEESIKRLVRDKELRTELSCNAYDTAQSYSYDRVVLDLEQAMKDRLK